jgi:pimeloyl-ACP methyl ester carboxylesterase
LDEREFVATVEAADPEELARLLSRPTVRQEEVLAAHFGEERYSRMHERALRRNLRRAAEPPLGNVVVLHGIMGAALTSVDRRGKGSLIWVQALKLLGGGLARLALEERGLGERDERYTVHASGILKRYYGELLLALSEQWRVRAFWYDWRKDLRLAADALNTAIANWFPSGEPVHLVAHSMGGLVARSFVEAHPERWESMWDKTPKSPGARGGRLVMLGTPNHGSFDIPPVICGMERVVRLLALGDLRMSLERLRDVLNSFVGTYQMLPSPLQVEGVEPLYDAKTYSPLKVSQRHLDNALAHHERLRTVVQPERMVYVAGMGENTRVGINSIDRVREEDAYERSLAGDGRVAHTLGRLETEESPAREVPVYFAPTDHGGLTTSRTVLDALTGLLRDGSTGALDSKPAATRGADEDSAALRAQAEARDQEEETRMRHLLRQVATRERVVPSGSEEGATSTRSATEEGLVSDQERRVEDVLVRGWLNGDAGATAPARAVRRPTAPKIRIDLCHGDIAAVHETLAEETPPVDVIAVGHYEGVKPAASELALDRAISPEFAGDGGEGAADQGVLTQLALRGTIAGSLGQPFFLVDPRATPGGREPRLIVLAGMGVPGRFGAGELTVTARELCWASGRLGRRHLATVLIGAGTGNLHAADAIEAWGRGIAQALAGHSDRPALERITFVEFDPGQLLDADRALTSTKRRLAADGLLELEYEPASKEACRDWRAAGRAQEEKSVRARWRRDSPAEAPPERAPTRITITREGNSYRFGAITARAAVPERDIPLDPVLVAEANDQLAGEPDPERRRDQGRFLARLLFPADLRGELSGGAPIVLLLDSSTARIHWELVTRPYAQPRPAGRDPSSLVEDHLGVGGRLTRQLRTTFAPPPEPPPPSERLLRVLVVADPAEDAPLPGAEEEGIAVADLFERLNDVGPASAEVVRLFGPRQATRTAVLRHLILERFHVLHFAGHCFYDKVDPAASGWIFGGGASLAARELRRIDRVPEFVFSNACESGITPDRAGHRSVGLAPSFAESFFERGVGNFVCTAWPVDDEAARGFAAALYESLLGLAPGEEAGVPLPMYKAMQRARRAIAGEGGGVRSWGAYQHYGDPLYRLMSVPAQAGDGSDGAPPRRRAAARPARRRASKR